MASYDIPAAQAALIAQGGADGYVQVADNSPFYPNAYIWLMKADGSDGGQYTITDLVGTTKIGLRAVSSVPTYGRSKLTAYLPGAMLFQEAQLVRVDEPTKIAKGQQNLAPLAEIYFGDPDENITNTGAEEVLVQSVLDFGAISSVNVECEVTGMVRSAANNATLKIRYGGTDLGVDGTVILTSAPIAGAAFAAFSQKVTVAKPAGVQIVKLTMQSSAGAVEAAIKNALVKFRGV